MPDVDFGIEGPACENAPISFVDHTTSAVGPPTALTWNFDNIATSIEYNPQVIFPTSGSKNVTLQVRTYYGCESEKTKIIEVGSRPLIDFTYSKDCDGNVAFSPLIQNNTYVTNWNWSFGDLSSSAQSQPQHHYKANGQYESSLHVTSNLGCISDTIQKNVFINKVYPFAGSDNDIIIGGTFATTCNRRRILSMVSGNRAQQPIANPRCHAEQVIKPICSSSGIV
jgi:PKD repeat protein